MTDLTALALRTKLAFFNLMTSQFPGSRECLALFILYTLSASGFADEQDYPSPALP
ncbi:hypothetical protein [Pontibacter mucosus]|uniref:hypothetical protein n=1 Tax=Pontibacter mucosus TaxID=1649266 RepID=UPI001474555E|nr:hypothetical protein [Pontibacter mucosus]